MILTGVRIIVIIFIIIIIIIIINNVIIIILIIIMIFIIIRMIQLINIKPRWDHNYKGHVLNFQGITITIIIITIVRIIMIMIIIGRVTESSVKNFQLCVISNATEDVVLQFGRVGINIIIIIIIIFIIIIIIR